MDQVISYREATVEDVATICELGQLLNAIHHAERPDIYTAETLDYTRDASHWMSFLNNPEQVIFLAFIGGRAAGFVSAGMFSAGGPLMQPMAFARIGSVCVAKVFWGRGLGRGLIERVQGWRRSAARRIFGCRCGASIPMRGACMKSLASRRGRLKWGCA
jgi:GNAT superfamily N-acetyltransferase